MSNFEGKQFRDTLARELKGAPKDERRFYLDVAKEQPEYQKAKEEQMQQRLDAVNEHIYDTSFIQEATPAPESDMSKVAKPKDPVLSPGQELEVQKIVKNDGPEALAHYLKNNGFPATTRAELLMHYTKELDESIRLIAWTKRRLMYTTAILEHTLSTSEKGVTSAENLIQNYLIFCRIFEESESKIPRFGQFAYVMRSIFGGVTSTDDIYNRIQSHKTFGEHITLDRGEVESLAAQVGEVSKVVHKNFLAAQERKRRADEALIEAGVEEDRSKGAIWTVGFGKPREYAFPNYTFQSGPDQGKNHAVGRSSWEPMLLAYADVVNKRMEERIMAKSDLSDQEKQERVRSQRIELLYEQFQFPVDVRIGEGEVEKPVLYILDFIDINRWRAVEVKGPLTPKGAEKIRLFKKYYVDGDFSDLPEEKKILMMTYVQNKKDEVAEWCRTHGYPVFDHFSSLEVLGAYKWDHDLNNFNQYKEVKGMKGLSRHEQDQLQKGFFKLVEDRIASGRTPDIRPEGYMKTEKIPDVVRANEVEAKAKKVPYIVENPCSTKPYLPNLLANEYLNYYKQHNGSIVPANWSTLQRVLETLPLSSYEIERLIGIRRALLEIPRLTALIQNVLENISEEKFSLINSGALSVHVPVEDEYNQAPEDFQKAMLALEKLAIYLEAPAHANQKGSKNDGRSSRSQIKFIRGFIKAHRNRYGMVDSKKTITLDKSATKMPEEGLELQQILVCLHESLLGRFSDLMRSRFAEVTSLTSDYLTYSNIDNYKERLTAFKDNNERLSDLEYWSILIPLSLVEEDMVNLRDLYILFLFALDPNVSFSGNTIRLLNLLKECYGSFDAAVQRFNSQNKDCMDDEYKDLIRDVEDVDKNLTKMTNEEIIKKEKNILIKRTLIVSIARAVVKERLGEAVYEKIMKRIRDNIENY